MRGIKTIEEEVVFCNGFFTVDDMPLYWHDVAWDLDSIKSAINSHKDLFDDPEEGDLIYLIEDVAQVKDEKELLDYLRGIEVIGNIHENPEPL